MKKLLLLFYHLQFIIFDIYLTNYYYSVNKKIVKKFNVYHVKTLTFYFYNQFKSLFKEEIKKGKEEGKETTM